MVKLMANKSDELRKEKHELLKFEYQELREERKRNTYISYVLMSILLLSSFSIFEELIKDDIETEMRLVAGILSSLLILIAYLIDRRLTYFNKERAKMMEIIEAKLDIANLNGEKLRKKLEKECVKKGKETWLQIIKNRFLKVRIHCYIFFIFIILTDMWLYILEYYFIILILTIVTIIWLLLDCLDCQEF